MNIRLAVLSMSDRSCIQYLQLRKTRMESSHKETLGAKHLYIMKHEPTSFDRETEVIAIKDDLPF
jgi:hypothetical protein